MLPPSRPGTGSRFSTLAVSWRNASSATPAQNSTGPLRRPRRSRTRRHQHQGEHHVGGRAGEADQGVPQPAGDGVPVDPDRAAGQADAAEQHHDHRQHDRQQRVGVLQRVERQVAPVGDVPVAGPVGGHGVGVLVQAERDQPARDDEEEHVEPDVAEPVPGQHAAGREERDQAEEDRAGPERRRGTPSTSGVTARAVVGHHSAVGCRLIR